MHTHKPHCLTENSGCRGLNYSEWIELASRRIDQDHTWQEHERLGRMNEKAKRELMPWYYDIGGEG